MQKQLTKCEQNWPNDEKTVLKTKKVLGLANAEVRAHKMALKQERNILKVETMWMNT